MHARVPGIASHRIMTRRQGRRRDEFSGDPATPRDGPPDGRESTAAALRPDPDGREHIRHAGRVLDALLPHPGIGPFHLCSALISPEDLAQAAA